MMMANKSNLNAHWKKQIRAAKDEHKVYFDQAKKCNESYSKSKSYNIFYSNTQVITSNLLTNQPKPDIQRRFLKKAESDKLKYNTYLEVAKVAEGCINYYADIGKALEKFKSSVRNSVKVGRGVSWVEYTPVIKQDQEGNSFIESRNLEVHPLGYKEFLCSSAEKEDDVWWVARRHLLSKEEIEERFDYKFTADFSELNFTENGKSNQTAQKRGEVWEIWDKTKKQRVYILMNSQGSKPLEVTKDPYKLESFFPCDFSLSWLNNGENIIPIPEYNIYREKATTLDELSKAADRLEDVIKYVLTTTGASKDNADAFANADEGDMIEIKQSNPQNESAATGVSMVPLADAISLATHRENKKQLLKNDIYEITGISDLHRGVSNANDTATAQKIKGVFGSLRFQDRQKKVQEHIKNVYQIMTEIICEHWDAETMSEITCTYLPTQEQKDVAQFKFMQYNIAMGRPDGQQLVQAGMIQQPTQDEIKLLEQPTWDDLVEIMQDDKLRNYTIDIETTATVFDDMELQNNSIMALNSTYKEIVMTGTQMGDPSLIRGYMPIAKMLLTNIKAGRALGRQLIESLEESANNLEQQQQQAASNPQPNPEMLKIQLEQAKMQQDAADKQSLAAERMAKVELDRINAQNKAKELALKEIESAAKIRFEQTKVSQNGAKVAADIAQGNRDLDIQQQEANRKDQELQYQALLKANQVAQGQNVNTNIPGDVDSLG